MLSETDVGVVIDIGWLRGCSLSGRNNIMKSNWLLWLEVSSPLLPTHFMSTCTIECPLVQPLRKNLAEKFALGFVNV